MRYIFAAILLTASPSFAQELSTEQYRDLLTKVQGVVLDPSGVDRNWLEISCKVIGKTEREKYAAANSNGGSYMPPIAAIACVGL